jgi:hypothetical protein
MADRQRLRPAPCDPRRAQGHARALLPRPAAPRRARVRRPAAGLVRRPGRARRGRDAARAQSARVLRLGLPGRPGTGDRRALGLAHDAAAGVPRDADRGLCRAFPRSWSLPWTWGARDGWSARMDPTEAVARSITAIAALATLPWKDFFDRTSLVDAALRRDPAGIYAGMDFESRDLYRKAVEDLGRGSGRVETEVVRLALEMSAAQPDDARRGHVGHWLIGSGRAELEGALGYRPPFASRHLRWIRSRARPLYFAVLVLFCLAALLLPVGILWNRGAGPAAYAGGILLSLVPAGILAVTLTHWLVTLILPPRTLPKLDFEAGLPEGRPRGRRDPGDLPQCRRGRPASRTCRDELADQSGPEPALRRAERFRRRRGADAALGRRDPRRAARRHRPPERPLPRPPALRAPAPATLPQRGRRHLDGVGAQARQAVGVQRLHRHRKRRGLSRACGRGRKPDRHALRHHDRRGHDPSRARRIACSARSCIP